jgi:hypothetical protein
MEVEILEIPPLKAGELSLVKCHSLLNAYHVLRCELVQLGRLCASDPDWLRAGLCECDLRIARLRMPKTALIDAGSVHAYEGLVFSEIGELLRQRPQLERDAAVSESLANARSVLWILQVRSRELLARAATASDAWTTVAIPELEADFHEFFRALEQNSHGRYHFVHNLALQTARDYYLELKLESARGTTITLPAIFKDVMRDLIANARKYTPPGGRIHAALHSGTEGVRFVVEDNGRGIPATELQSVVQPGRRGSNVTDVRTMGGGYGLTKAFLVTHHLRGRLWISSEVGRGTQVRIWLPPPPNGNGIAHVHE